MKCSQSQYTGLGHCTTLPFCSQELWLTGCLPHFPRDLRELHYAGIHDRDWHVLHARGADSARWVLVCVHPLSKLWRQTSALTVMHFYSPHGRIRYHRARSVGVWLSPHQDNTFRAVAVVSRLPFPDHLFP